MLFTLCVHIKCVLGTFAYAVIPSTYPVKISHAIRFYCAFIYIYVCIYICIPFSTDDDVAAAIASPSSFISCRLLCAYFYSSVDFFYFPSAPAVSQRPAAFRCFFPDAGCWHHGCLLSSIHFLLHSARNLFMFRFS